MAYKSQTFKNNENLSIFTNPDDISLSGNAKQKAEKKRLKAETQQISNLILSHGIVDRYNMDWTHKFSRFGVLDPFNTLTNTREYLFFTKPDLCLLTTQIKNATNSAYWPLTKVLSNNAFFVDAINRYRDMAEQLQSSYKQDYPFMNVLSNSVTSTLDLPGLSAENIESAGNVMGTKINYRGTSYKSDEDFDFNLEFEDTKRLDIYMLFKMYDEYEKLKWNGAIDFVNAETDRWKNYILNRVLHDQFSIYKIVVGEDGYRIVYFARITGCYPTSIPRDAFSDMNRISEAGQKLTVGFKGHFVRDMDPIILSQFNKLSLAYKKGTLKGTKESPLFDTTIHAINGEWPRTPYIHTQVINGRREYFLRWVN